MSGTKRLAKRSIIGTRVSALWQDGRYYPGVIRALAAEETLTTKALYTVHFDDGFETSVAGKEIIGPGFQTVPSTRLKHAQKVFVTMNGREICGLVANHDRKLDEVVISVKQGNNEETTINRKLEEVRLMESRKSARLVDQDTDYSKLADLQLSEPKRRAVSHSIDVPGFKQHPKSPTPLNTQFKGEFFFCLTQIESAPASFEFPRRTDLPSDSDTRDSDVTGKSEDRTRFQCTWRGCSLVCDSCNEIERHIRRAHFDQDSDLELSDKEEEFYYTELEDDKDVVSVTQSFAGMYTSSPSGEQPDMHEMARTFDHDYQRKEEKYKPFAHASSVPSGDSYGLSGATTSIPITIPEGQIKRSLSWQIQAPSPGALVSPPLRTPKLTPQERLQQHQAQSPKSHMLMSPLKSAGPHHRKPRSEVRKCRKVYGMENRDQWCTQCKWKKACTRFID
nr:hypothetical protein BaRGS_002573 [Batillaria attramentaria]